MASLAQKLPSCLALLSLCCILVVFVSVFRPWQEPWQKLLTKHINAEQSVQIHQEYSNQSPGKSTSNSREATMQMGVSGHKVLSASVKRSVTHKFQGQQKNMLTEHNQAEFVWNSPDEFWNMTYEERSKFQRQQVDEYCRRYTAHNEKEELPARHLLLHKEKEVAFCYIPKSACTTFKILLLHSQGMLPDQYLDYNEQKQPHIAPQLRKILLSALDSKEHEATIKNYFKFVMFRHPLERLLSGYRSKMSVAVKGGEKMTDENNRDVEGDIFLFDKELLILHAYPNIYLKWKAAHESYPVNITFSDFIDYWVKSERLSLNAHFNSVLRQCRPCTVQYDYYGNFKTFRSDSKLLMEKIGASEKQLRPQYPKSSDELVNEYYGQLSDSQKLKILKKLAPELRFYYMLFPPEKDTHKRMLGINADID